jgi:hypothetical protein
MLWWSPQTARAISLRNEIGAFVTWKTRSIPQTSKRRGRRLATPASYF